MQGGRVHAAGAEIELDETDTVVEEVLNEVKAER